MKKFWRKGEAVIRIMEKILGPGFYRNTRTAAEIKLLNPGREGRQKIREYYGMKFSRMLLILMFGILLFGILAFFHSAGTDNVGEVERSSYDGSEKTVTLEAETQDGYSETYEVNVSSQTYSPEEAAVRIQEEIGGMAGRILGKNCSPDHISCDLELPSRIDPGPIKLKWESSDPEVLETNGKLHNENIPEEGMTVTVRCFLACMDQTGMYETDIEVFPAETSVQEQFRALVTKALSKADEDTRTSGTMVLPSEVAGRSVSWNVPDSRTALKVLILFTLLAALSFVLEDKKFHKEVELRNLQMQADYPDILDKLVLLLGAGMTVRQAWDRITDDYSGCGRKKRYVYEEMILCSKDIKRGTSEQAAYDAFGRRCGGTQYPKLASLLSQNLRKGSNGLVRIFRQEAEESFDERKNYARRRAEEAGTKLLMPMFLMLVMILIIIMIPAFRTMIR